jgi:hypothetical protein
MRHSLLAVTLLALIIFTGRKLQAQVYGPYYYGSYWDVQYQQYLEYQRYLEWQQYLAYLQQHDPYYELHVMHYQLYLPPQQPYLYQPCCYPSGVILPAWPMSLRPEPRSMVRPRAPAMVSPLPTAVAPLPRAVSPMTPATRRR